MSIRIYIYTYTYIYVYKATLTPPSRVYAYFDEYQDAMAEMDRAAGLGQFVTDTDNQTSTR